MKKPISVSNLTLNLWLDYVRPAAIAAGIIDLTATEDGKQIYVTDTATADEIAHCMYCACMCAGNDGIERTHEEYIRHEAERMIGQLEVSIKYDLHNTVATLTALLDAMTAALQPAEAPQEAPAAEAEQQPTTTDEAPQMATQAAEEPTTDEEKEEANTMSNTTERYDYLEHMTADVIDAIRERYTDDEIRARLDDDRDELAQDLSDDLWTDDSVTGNASGSYYCNAWRAEDAIAHNWDLISDMVDEFDAADILRNGPEAIDVSIRCYLLGQAIDAALDQLDDEIPEAEEIDEEEEEAR